MEFFYSKNKNFNSLPGVHLLQDHIGSGHTSPWDDYGFVTTFKTYYVENSEATLLGEIKVLADGSNDTSKYFAQHGIELKSSSDSLNITSCLLSEKVVSLPIKNEYYERLHSLLSTDRIEQYLNGICDAGYFIDNYEIYVNWKGFSLSLVRDGQSAEARIKKGYRIALGNYSPDPVVEISIETLGNTFEPISFAFNNEKGQNNSNINLLIGANGTGKSHILKHVTELLTGLAQGNEIWPYFHKLIVVAYSPFENFYSNKELAESLAKSKSEGESLKGQLTTTRIKRLQKINKYSYVGFKNNAGSFNTDWPPEYSIQCILQILDYDEENRWKESSRLELLVNTLQLSVKFDHLAIKLRSGEILPLETGSQYIQAHARKNELDLKSGIHFIRNGVPVPLSSGQKIYSYIMPALVSEIERESLIILDEPELYLHPTLEVGLITMLRSVLSETNSYALIATHSAILAREVKSKGIRILRKKENSTAVSLPTFETYGESLDRILGEAFGDYETPKPYQSDISNIIEHCPTPSEALKLVGNVGDEALTYVLSRFSDSSDEIEIEIEAP